MIDKDAAIVESARCPPPELPNGLRCWTSPLDPARAFAVADDRFCKLAERSGGHSGRQQDLRGEFELLRRCRGVAGVPEALELIEDDARQILVLRRIRGEPLSRLDLGWAGLIGVLLRVAAVIWALARRGVRHNDLRPENIMVGEDGRVQLVDFDQATRGGLVECLFAGLGLRIAGAPVCNGLLAPLRERLQARLSPRLIRVLRGRRLRRRRRQVATLAPLTRDAGPELRTLHEAWRLAAAANASSPGDQVAYYQLTFQGIRFPGERPWQPRWDRLRRVTTYAERRILELGCNMALLSTFALKEGGARAALAVDADPMILEAAAKVAAAFEAAPTFRQVDFDRDPGWEAELETFQPDVVIALSVLHWIRDQARFLAFLGRFDEVIFEGHDSACTERRRLREAGFTVVDLIDTSERGRPLLLARKS